MERYLITGFSGFVSGHFLEYLGKNVPEAEVLGIDINEPAFSFLSSKSIKYTFIKADLLDSKRVKDILTEFKPNYILHLASFSSVAFSWNQPVVAIINNLNIFLNLVDQIRLLGLDCRLLSVGSSEEYGRVDPEMLPLSEEFPVYPTSPYAVARVSQEYLSSVYCLGYGLDIIMTRSFNHIGPGQNERFAIPSFVKKILELKKSGGSEIAVGNIEIVRDFVDVRDVVHAYYLLLKKGKRCNIYNICSGKGYSLRDVLREIMTITGIEADLVIDKSLIRPSDNPIVIGSFVKIKEELDWLPHYGLHNSLVDIVDFWKLRLNG